MATAPLPPENLRVTSVTSSSVSLSWDRPDNMITDLHKEFKISSKSAELLVTQKLSWDTRATDMTGLSPGREYTFTLCTAVGDSVESSGVSVRVCTGPLPPQSLRATSVTSSSVSLSWDRPDNMITDLHKEFKIKYRDTGGDQSKPISWDTRATDMTGLSPGREYTFTLCTAVGDSVESSGVSVRVCTAPFPPQNLRVTSVTSSRVFLSWDRPDNMITDLHKEFKIKYRDTGGDQSKPISWDTRATDMTGLSPGREYTFTLCTAVGDSVESSGVSVRVCTGPFPPKTLRVTSVSSSSVSLSWDRPDNMEAETQKEFKIKYRDTGGDQSKTISWDTRATDMTDLSPGREYTFTLCTAVGDSVESSGVSVRVCTDPLPQNFRVTSVTSSSVSLSWDRPDNMITDLHKEFKIKYRDTGGDQSKPISWDTRATDMTGLSPGREYTFTLCTAVGDSVESSGVSVRVCTVPLPPQNFRATSVTSSSVSLNWDRPDIIITDLHKEFKIKYRDTGDQSKPISWDTRATDMTGLSPGREYTFTLCTAVGDSVESSGVSVSVCTVPLPPENLRVTSVTSSSVSLSWDRPDNMITDLHKEFKIKYRDTGRDQSKIISWDTRATDMTDLSPGREYTFTLCTAVGDSVESSGVSVRVCTAPLPPQNLRVTSVTSSSVSLSWDRPDNMITDLHKEFKIKYRDTGGDQSKTISWDTRATDMTGLSPGREYTFTLCTAVGDSVESSGVSVRVWTAPLPPQNLRVTSVTSSSVSLSWDRPDNMITDLHKEFKIKYRDTGGDQSKTISWDTRAPDMTGLSPGREYTFTLCTAVGDSVESSGVSVRVCTAPLPPQNLRVISVTSSSVSLSWDRPDTMETDLQKAFKIKYRDTEGDQSKTISWDTRATDMTDLSPGREYTFTLCTAVGDSVESSGVSVRVWTAPLPPQNLRVTSVTSSSVSLSWDRPDNMITDLHKEFKIKYRDTGGDQSKTISWDTRATDMTGLSPGREYTFTLCTAVGDSVESSGVSVRVCTAPLPPQNLRVISVTSSSVSLSWDRPDTMETDLHKEFKIKYRDTEGDQSKTISWDTRATDMTDLSPGREYTFTLCTAVGDSVESSGVSVRVWTAPLPPENLRVTSVTSSSVSLSWDRPDNMITDLHKEFKIKYRDTGGDDSKPISWDTRATDMTGLSPGREYTFTLCTAVGDSVESSGVSVRVCTAPLPPENLRVTSVTSSRVFLSWDRPDNMITDLHKEFKIKYRDTGGDQSKPISWDTRATDMTGLSPGREYTFTLCTAVGDSVESSGVSVRVCTDSGSWLSSLRAADFGSQVSSSFYIHTFGPAAPPEEPEVRFLGLVLLN
ncbi:fibronectin-like [Lepisosteus oculatus]|uniref:fibronectin-like n=1 Tax=Lepisosteus oculatus TaxID=7918 RepID=UPI0035F51475